MKRPAVYAGVVAVFLLTGCLGAGTLNEGGDGGAELTDDDGLPTTETVGAVPGCEPDVSEEFEDDGVVTTVTMNGVVEREGRESCSFTVEVDYPDEDEMLPMGIVEVKGYVSVDGGHAELLYYNSDGVLRMERTREDGERSLTYYGEDGEEVETPATGQIGEAE